MEYESESSKRKPLLTVFVLACASRLSYINPARAASAAAACSTRSPSSGSDTVTVCFGSPASGSAPGIQKNLNTDSRVVYNNSSNPAAFGVLRLSLTSTAANFAYHSINRTSLDSGTVACN